MHNHNVNVREPAVKYTLLHTKEYKKNLKAVLHKQELHPIIKLLYNAGLFSFVFPEVKTIVHQPQFDGYHQHPVDVHSINALKFSERIKKDEIKTILNGLEYCSVMLLLI